MNLRSPWGDATRAPLRAVIALVAVADLAALSVLLGESPAGPRSHPAAPELLLAFGAHPGRVAPVVALGALGAAGFAWRSASVGPPLLLLFALALLTESAAALADGPMRNFFFVGAVLFGWICGLVFSRVVHGSGHASAAAARRADGMGEAGAAAALAGTYVGASSAKLLASGAQWTSPDMLRSVILAQHGVPERSPFALYVRLLTDHPGAVHGLALLTLIIEGGAFLYPWSPRLRALWGTLLIGLHANIWLLMPILYAEAIVLLAALSYPWPRWAALARHGAAPGDLPPAWAPLARVRRATIVGAAIVVALSLLALKSPLRSYAALHHQHDESDSPEASPSPGAGSRVAPLFAALAPGATVSGWRVVALRGPKAGAVTIYLDRGPSTLRLIVVRRGARPFSPPAASDLYDLFYEGPSPRRDALSEADLSQLLGEVAEHLRAVEHEAAAPEGL